MSDWWRSRTWRFIQTNLREIDMLDIDAERVVADMRSFSANVLMINAAGIIASYPTALPFQFQSPYLEGDSLQDIIAACHAADIRVIARTDFSKVRREIHERYPHWASVTEAGNVIDYNGDVQVCVNGEYQQEYVLQIVEELLTTHDFDGIFFNMAGYQTHDYSGRHHGICHCGNCRDLFREMFGLDLPGTQDGREATRRKYRVFQRRTLEGQRRRVYEFITDLRPEIAIANHREFGRGFNRMEANTAIGRALPHWQYAASENTKWAVSSYPEMVSSSSSVDFIDFPYRHVAVSPHQQALRLAQNLANGGALDYYLIGRLDNHEDRSAFDAIKGIYRYHADNEDAYANTRSMASVALLRPDNVNTAEYRGWFRVLTENHFPFDVLTPDAAESLPWASYRAIILPDARCLSDELAERLDAHVAEGGAVVASGQTGSRDQDDEPRSTVLLRCLGIERVERVRDDMQSSYFAVEDKRAFPSFGDTDLVYVDGPYVYAVYGDDTERHLKLIPPHNFGPPERCYYEEVTGHPGVACTEHGDGLGVYIPWLPGALFHRQGHLNTASFMADVLTSLAGIEPIGGSLPASVEVTRFESGDHQSQLVHLVNGPGHFGVSFYAPITMADLTIEFAADARPASVRSLVAQSDYPWTWTDGSLAITVPRLELFDAIVIR